MIKKITISILIIFLVACRSNSYTTLTLEQTMNELKLDSSIILLDVRSLEEHEELNIDGSILIPLDELESRANDELSKESRIFVYCQTGKRSKQASEILVNMGYKNIYNIAGLEEWDFTFNQD